MKAYYPHLQHQGPGEGDAAAGDPPQGGPQRGLRLQRQGAAQEHVGAEARVPPLQEGGEGGGGEGEESRLLGLGLNNCHCGCGVFSISGQPKELSSFGRKQKPIKMLPKGPK